MCSLVVVGPVLSWRERYVRNYVFAFCACGWGGVLFRNLLAGKVCFCVFVFPENKPVDTALMETLKEIFQSTLHNGLQRYYYNN
jgi:hypothetical protein